MLSKKDAETVVDILLKEDLQLDEYKNLLQNAFPESQYFHILNLLSILLQNCILEYNQQFEVFYMLLTSYDCIFEENPFLPLFNYIYEARFENRGEFHNSLTAIIAAFLSHAEIPDLKNSTIQELSNFTFHQKSMNLHFKSGIRPSILHLDNKPRRGHEKSYENLAKINQNDDNLVVLSYRQLLITFLIKNLPFSLNVPPLK